ncbi:hypothetical protein [Actinokineospora alba]|uniref:hypothetical protein n=1 Tax=Actinokineospora alba TaxID=504798 RepID=UPI001061E911|nr:hypothetical protein [Actinokineospora alba]
MTPEKFVDHHILDRVPWLFPSWWSYREWKSELAAGLNVDPHDIIVVGSAALGFSLAPSKDLSAFHDGSDIDVAVISTWHFEAAWRELRAIDAIDRLHRGGAEADYLSWHRRDLVYSGAIATDKVLHLLSFGHLWTIAFAHAANRDPTIGREIRARIYRDCESLRIYNVKNVRKLRNRLIYASIDEDEPDDATN